MSASEHPPMTTTLTCQIVDRATWCVLRSVQLREADRPRETRIATRSVGENDEMSLTVSMLNDKFGSEHRGQSHGTRRLGETHDAVQAVAIGERESSEIETIGLGDQSFGVGCSVEEREVRVTVQFGVRDTRSHPRWW